MNKSEKIVPSNLIYGINEFPRVTDRVAVAVGSYKEGEVLEYDKTTSKYIKLATADNAAVIVLEDVEVKATEKILVYFTGVFNEKALILKSGITVAGIKEALKAKSIFLKK